MFICHRILQGLQGAFFSTGHILINIGLKWLFNLHALSSVVQGSVTSTPNQYIRPHTPTSRDKLQKVRTARPAMFLMKECYQLSLGFLNKKLRSPSAAASRANSTSHAEDGLSVGNKGAVSIFLAKIGIDVYFPDLKWSKDWERERGKIDRRDRETGHKIFALRSLGHESIQILASLQRPEV